MEGEEAEGRNPQNAGPDQNSNPDPGGAVPGPPRPVRTCATHPVSAAGEGRSSPREQRSGDTPRPTGGRQPQAPARPPWASSAAARPAHSPRRAG